MNMLSIVIAAGVLIIGVLALIASRLLLQVHQQKKLRERKLLELEESNAKAQQEQRAWLNKSIQILAQAVGREELTLTEASIRIAGLLDALDANESIKTEFSAFYQLREKTSHIPYLDAWKNLSDAEQRKFDMERLRQEATFNDFVMDAAQRIIGKNF